MAHSWSQAVATDGNPWQMAREEKPLKQAKNRCHRLRPVANRSASSGRRPPFAAAYADVLPETPREALRDAAITYLDDSFSTIADAEPGQSYADTPIGSYLPSRYE
jgi:hypothetical protein